VRSGEQSRPKREKKNTMKSRMEVEKTTGAVDRLHPQFFFFFFYCDASESPHKVIDTTIGP
jgi:hypothetical protein